jgi:hypothetical protein
LGADQEGAETSVVELELGVRRRVRQGTMKMNIGHTSSDHRDGKTQNEGKKTCSYAHRNRDGQIKRARGIMGRKCGPLIIPSILLGDSSCDWGG